MRIIIGQIKLLLVSGLVPALLMMSGCGDFFDKRSTNVQSTAILEELSQVKESPFVDNPVPEIYKQRATRLPIKDGIKLFYFTQNHPANHLALLLEQQLGVKSTTSNSVNQIVAYCKDDVQADAVQQFLELIDVEPIQVNIDCLILERFGDVTMDWETSLLVENLVGENITLGKAHENFLRNADGSLKLDSNGNPIGDLDPAFPGASLREAERSNFGVDFGYWDNKGIEGHQVRAVVDVLVSRGYLKILLNPQLETVNGKVASVTIKDYTPIEEVRTDGAGIDNVYNITKYVWVEDTLTVLPNVYTDGTIGLKTDIRIGSRSKPEGVVQRSIITERSINVEENRIKQGYSLIIGGMRKSEKRSVVRGVPFFKDLPVIGVLFSSKDFEEKGTEIIFILTPSISSGAVPNKEIVEDLRRKHADPEFKSSLTEPLSSSIYTEALEKEATDAELKRVEAELTFEQASRSAEAEKQRADTAEEESQKLALKAAELQKQAEQLNLESGKILEQITQIKSQGQLDQDKIKVLEDQKAKLGAEAQKTLQEAEQARTQAEQVRVQAEQSKTQAEQLRIQAEQRRIQAEELAKEVAAKEAAVKEAAVKEAAAKEAAAKEAAAKEAAAKEAAAKEAAAKEAAAKEAETQNVPQEAPKAPEQVQQVPPAQAPPAAPTSPTAPTSPVEPAPPVPAAPEAPAAPIPAAETTPNTPAAPTTPPVPAVPAAETQPADAPTAPAADAAQADASKS